MPEAGPALGNQVTGIWKYLEQNLFDNPVALGWIAFGSIALLAASILLIPFAAARIPADYFGAEKKKAYAPKNVFLYVVYKVVKNLAGAFFVTVGFIQLVTPGQGLLTILIGSLLLDYPGKYHFQRWLIQKKPIRDGLNWLRKLGGAPPLDIDL